jgi:hypothetical protein
MGGFCRDGKKTIEVIVIIDVDLCACTLNEKGVIEL